MTLHRSPALTLLFNEIKQSSGIYVLDLGSMNKANFDFLNQLRCKIQIEDLSAHIAETIAAGELQRLQAVDEFLFDYKGDKYFDVILTWDVFNYLSLDSVEKLMQKLSLCAKPNTLIHAIRYLEKKIPSVPQNFFICDQYTLNFELKTPTDRLFDPVSTMQLIKKIPDYKMEHTFINKEGMHNGCIEHLLRYKPGNSFKKVQAYKEECYDKPLSKTNAKVHASPSLKIVCNHLRRKKNAHILIIGKPFSRNTDFFIEYCQGVYHADIYPLLQWQKNNNDQRGIQQESLNVDANTKVDVVLTWDFFNFCNLEQLSQINHFLKNIIQPDALLMTYVYLGKTSPNKPQQFEIADKDRVYTPEFKQGVKPELELTCGNLLKTLRHFDLDSSFLYRQGMSSAISEYIFKAKEHL